ncbi:MAG: hypothetical protein WC897_01690 [Candidatus Gracilibacteria bacterium]
MRPSLTTAQAIDDLTKRFESPTPDKTIAQFNLKERIHFRAKLLEVRAEISEVLHGIIPPSKQPNFYETLFSFIKDRSSINDVVSTINGLVALVTVDKQPSLN